MDYSICSQNINTCYKETNNYVLHGFIKYDKSCVISNCSFLIEAKFAKYITNIKIIYDDISYNVQFDTIANTGWTIGAMCDGSHREPSTMCDYKYFSLDVPRFLLTITDDFVRTFEIKFMMTKKFAVQFYYVKYNATEISEKTELVSYDILINACINMLSFSRMS